MKKLGLVSRQLPKHRYSKIAREHIETPNQVWVGDMTYVWAGNRWSYLAVVIDLFVRKPIGWAMSFSLDSQLTDKALKARLENCGLELHPTTTKIVYCKDGRRKGDLEHTSFDFLGYTFMRRVCKNWKRNSLFLSFSPTVSKSALKSMRFKLRKLRVRMKTELSMA